MKYYVFCFIFVFFLQCQLKADTDPTFLIGTNTIQVSFGAATLSETNKAKICSDLARVFSFSREITNAFSKVEQSDMLRPVEMDIPGPVAPQIQTGVLLQTSDGTPLLLLSEKTVAAYLAGLEFGNKHAALIVKTDTLLGSFNTGAVTNLTTQEKRDLFWYPAGTENNFPDSHIVQAVEKLASLVSHKPSILNYTPGTEMTDETIPQIETFFVVTDPLSGKIYNVYGIVFFDDKPKLYVF